MTVIDEVLLANQAYAAGFDRGSLAARPLRGLAVVACMDTRMDVEDLLGLAPGEAIIIRNAGGIVTGDVLRSLVVSHHLLGALEVMIINHTECGMQSFRDDELRERLAQSTGANPDAPAAFHAFADLDANVREQVEKVRSHPWISETVPVRGFVYDVRSGFLREVDQAGGAPERTASR